MTTGITLSAAVRNNLLSLQSTAKMMATTQNRLATGNKVNSAVDNATSYFTAQGLTNRASDLSGLQDNMGLAVKTVQAASTGIDGITKLVSQAKSIVSQAKLVTGTATASTAVGSAAVTSATVITSGKGLSVQVGSATAVSITGDGTKTLGDFITAFNADSASKAAGATASVDTNGKLNITATNGEVIKLVTDDTAISSGNVTSTDGKTAAVDKSDKLATYQGNYNDLLTQIDQLSSDATYNGVNLLGGNDLKVNFNADGSSSLNLKSVTYNAAGIGLSSLSSATDITSSTTSAALDKATSTLRTQASTFGSNLAVINNRQDFTQSTIDNLGAGAGDLTLADTNQEGANLLALQTRQSLATTALSLSNQAQSSILSILR